MKNVPENVGSSAAPEERFAGQTNYRGSVRREIGGIPTEPTDTETPRNGHLGSLLEKPLPTQPTMSLNEVTALSEPVFASSTWLEVEPTSFGTVADHPLLRGLLLELPPRGNPMPSRDWLDRWFEATRSILELIYVQEARPRPRR